MNTPPSIPAAPLASAPPDRTADARLISSATTATKIRRLAWAAVEGSLFRCSFHNMYAWRRCLLRCFGANVGPKTRVRRTARFYYPWNVTLGARCIIGDDTDIYSLGKIRIGDRAMISQQAYLCAGSHDYTDLALPLLTPPITIGPDAWICARAFIGPGVDVGPGAVVAACAVVVKNVDPWIIVGGNPAQPLKKRELKGTAQADPSAPK